LHRRRPATSRPPQLLCQSTCVYLTSSK
jgi:hypothetical protein